MKPSSNVNVKLKQRVKDDIMELGLKTAEACAGSASGSG